jgi:integrase/recombinase XerD
MAPPIRLHQQPSSATLLSELETFLADLHDRRGLAANTIASYRYDLRTAAQVLTAPLTDIAAQQVEAFLSERQERPSTTNRRIASLSRFFIWAQKTGLCDGNPIARIETKQDTIRLPRPIRDEDLGALDMAIAKARAPYRLIFTLLRETGVRVAEVLQLNVGDVSLAPSREGIYLREAKNNTERMVVLNADLMKRSLRLLRSTLRELGPVDAGMPLFRSNRGTRITYDTLYYQWQRLCTAAELLDGEGNPRYTIHQLRHTAGTAFIRNYPEHIVSRMLGHRDPRSTRRYAEVTEDQVRAVLAACRNDRRPHAG